MSCSTSSVYIVEIKIQRSKTVTNWSNSYNLTEEQEEIRVSKK